MTCPSCNSSMSQGVFHQCTSQSSLCIYCCQPINYNIPHSCQQGVIKGQQYGQHNGAQQYQWGLTQGAGSTTAALPQIYCSHCNGYFYNTHICEAKHPAINHLIKASDLYEKCIEYCLRINELEKELKELKNVNCTRSK
jgi:hypothetical protein